MATPTESRQPNNPFAVKFLTATLRKNAVFVFQDGPRRVHVLPQSFKVSYEEMTASALVLKHLSQMVSPHLSIPRQINIYLFDADSSQQHAGGLQMILSRVPKKEGQPDAALAHEAGHVIFQHNLKLRVQDDFRFWREKQRAILEELGNAELRSPHVLSFEELFSDLLAVLYARDGRAIADRLAVMYPGLKEHQIQSRDFTRTEPSPYSDAEVAPYGLQGTRFLIGQSYLKQTIQANNEGPFLRQIFDLLYEEFVDFQLGNYPAGSGFERRCDERLTSAVTKVNSDQSEPAGANFSPVMLFPRMSS